MIPPHASEQDRGRDARKRYKKPNRVPESFVKKIQQVWQMQNETDEKDWLYKTGGNPTRDVALFCERPFGHFICTGFCHGRSLGSY